MWARRAKGKSFPFKMKRPCASGDRLKLFFEPKSDQYFYLLHISSQGDLTPLFPVAAQPARVAARTQVFLPEGNQWFELDAHPGQEKFFLIATAERLDRLEELCARHTALKDKADVPVFDRCHPGRNQGAEAETQAALRPGGKTGPHRGQRARPAAVGCAGRSGRHPAGGRSHRTRVLQQDLLH